MNAKYLTWGKETTFSETCILSANDVLKIKTLKKKKTWKVPYMGKQNIIKNVSFLCFFSYLPKRYDACRKHFMKKQYNIIYYNI